SIDEFLQDVAFANPHLRLEYWPPNKKPIVYPRISNELPPETKEIKPHPYGVELGLMLRMAHVSKSHSLSGFLQAEFSRVSTAVADEILGKAELDGEMRPKDVRREHAERLHNAIADTKIMSPPTNCLAPIGEAAMLEGLKGLLVQQHIQAEEAKLRRKAEADGQPLAEDAAEQAEAKVTEALEAVKKVATEDDEEAGTEVPKAGVIELFGHQAFLTAVTRGPKVYRGNPFQVEAALAWGGELPGDQLAQVYRFANRVPLLYQQGACAMTQSVVRTNWKSYDVDQARGALPLGPLIVMVHIASVWVPFTSEAKEAVAHYDEIISELKFALQECGRRLARHIRRKRRIADAEKKQKYIEKYIPHIGLAVQEILGINDTRRDEMVDELTGILERSRKM
ncbi:MAG: DNA topoisomerase VI subunit B, partial [Myxococcota bacterium]